LWSLLSDQIQNYSQIEDGENYYYSLDFRVKEGAVYIANRLGKFYSVDIKTGKVRWFFDVGSGIVGKFGIYKDTAFVFSKDGNIFALNLKNGKLIWKQPAGEHAVCADIYKSNLVYQSVGGYIYKLNSKNGNVIWKSESFGNKLNCQEYYTSDGMFVTGDGEVIKIDMDNGETIWRKNLGVSTMLGLTKLDNGIWGRSYLLSGLDGRLISIGLNGNIRWIFNALTPIYVRPLIAKNNIYIGTVGSEIYKINRFLGKPLDPLSVLKFRTWLGVDKMAGNDIVEINLKSKNNFINPWTEGYLSADLIAPSGRPIHVDGFYYDDNVWKIRFNPPEKGVWYYTLVWNDHGLVNSMQGKFNSKSDTQNTYLKISPDNPRRLTLDGKTIFNGVGIQDAVLDFNKDGNALNDFDIGNNLTIRSTISAPVQKQLEDIKNNKDIISLKKYIDIYGPNGAGFNLFRFGVGNASNALYRDIFGVPFVYSTIDTEMIDKLFQELRQNNMHIWFSLFSFYLPSSNNLDVVQRSHLDSYIRYVIARYGAYIDIWELVNEFELSNESKKFLIDEIKKYDFENRLITIFPEDTKTSGIDIISPHWYETEPLSDSDKVTSEYIDRFKDISKPVIFGEQGNVTLNWGETSAERMRVRLWTAFYKEGMIIFWSNSFAKGTSPDLPYFYANIYLGGEERQYIDVLQKLTAGFLLSSKPISFDLSRKGIRGYGLISQDNFTAYYVHYSRWLESTKFTQVLNLLKPGTLEWYNVANGTLLGKTKCMITTCGGDLPHLHDRYYV
jgi:outer membrane protein assembly factor BamB